MSTKTLTIDDVKNGKVDKEFMGQVLGINILWYSIDGNNIIYNPKYKNIKTISISEFVDSCNEYIVHMLKTSKPNLTIEGIFKSLDAWREERGLQHTVGNIAANIGEEIVEYLRAENDDERVDALCDMFVFSVNAISAMGKMEYASLEMNLSILAPEIYEKSYFAEIVDRFALIAKYGYTLNVDALIIIAVYAKAQLCNAGYDFLIAMDETLKEIHSRKGAWNDELQKWEKFKTPEAMALWYKADYNNAKVMR